MRDHIIPLYENKDHIIDRLINLTSEQKEEIKAFFAKHPSYENKIDWNDKSLSYKYFEPILALDGKSKTQAKKKGIEGITEGKDYRYVGSGYNMEIGSYTLYQPLTYLGSMTLASNKVPPVRENGAKWCIAYQKTDQYWKDYTGHGIKFLFVLTEDTKYAITVYSEDLAYRTEVYDFEDNNLGYPSWCSDDDVIYRSIVELKGLVPLEEYIEKGVFVWNEQTGKLDKVAYGPVNMFSMVENGWLLPSFGLWMGDFDCRAMRLVSLTGCPDKVIGNFNCSGNQLKSLEGGPKLVSGHYDCSDNSLESLEGAPKRVGGDFDCSGNRLKSLEGGPESVVGDFRCQGNYLPSLIGGPGFVGGSYFCYHNVLKSLEGSPRQINGRFEAFVNSLQTLKGGPKDVYGPYIVNYNDLVTLAGCPDHVDGTFDCSNNPLYTLKGAENLGYCLFDCHFCRLKDLTGAPRKVNNFICKDNPDLTSLKGCPDQTRTFDASGCGLHSLEGLTTYIKGNLYIKDNPIDEAPERNAFRIDGSVICDHWLEDSFLEKGFDVGF